MRHRAARCQVSAAFLTTYMRSLLNQSANGVNSFPHTFIRFLSLGKGKKALPRILRHCTPDQTLAILTVILACMDQLDAVHIGVQASHHTIQSRNANEQLDLFLNQVMPSLLAFLTDTPMRIVLALLKLVAERNNIVWISRSKVIGYEMRYSIRVSCRGSC